MSKRFELKPECEICLNCTNFKNLYNFDHTGICNVDGKERSLASNCVFPIVEEKRKFAMIEFRDD